MSDLRTFIGTTNWGKDLNGILVKDKITFTNAIALLRTKNGRSLTYAWKTPVKWSAIFNYMSVDAGVHGSDDNTISKLAALGVSLLAVEGIGCSGTNFNFQSMNSTSSAYWSERYELYKHSYAMAVYSYKKGIKMIEFFNEPDLALGTTCLDSNKFLDFYKIRSLSIQNAYEDLNNETSVQASRINVQVVSSAFARRTYGGDTTRYLGDVSVQNRNYMFGNVNRLANWTNMHSYSYHTYDKSGDSIAQDLEYLKTEIRNDPTVNASDQIPVIITEHNSRTSSAWDTKPSTTDTNYEASRLASQIANIIKFKITSHYVFKFSVTESFSATRDIAKNGIHWGDIYSAPYLISDTTLSAEAMRILTQMKNSKIFPVISNDTSILRTYLASNNGLDGFYYLYIVNDANDTLNVALDASKWTINTGTQLILESAGSGFFGEIKDVLTASSSNALLSFSINPYSTNRLAIRSGNQASISLLADLSCTAKAGTQSSISSCASTSLVAGTSSVSKHENTSVALIRFSIGSSQLAANGQRTILKINVEEIVGTSDVTLQVLGLRNANRTWNQTTASWTSLTNGIQILKTLSSGYVIDSINKNFINWPSSADIAIVGHVSGRFGSKNQVKMIDVTEYVKSVINSGGKQFTFVLYRPYRFPSYKTSAGVLPADNLSNGSLVKISSATASLSSNSPQLIQYKNV